MSDTFEIDKELEACIWRGHSAGLVDMARGNPFSWSGAVQREILAFGQSPALQPRLTSYPPYLGCAAVLMIKDEADIILQNLRWLRHIGMRRFIVMDNNSQDETRNLVVQFATGHDDIEIFLIDDPVVSYLQAEKTTFMYEEAARRWPDLEWVFPLDADEFLNADDGLRALAFVPEEIDALVVSKAVQFQSHSAQAAGGTMFERMPVRSALFTVAPKVALRVSNNLRITQGNHQAESTTQNAPRYAGGFSHGLYYREMQLRSFEQFLRKIRNGSAAILAANAMGIWAGGDHWMGWHRALVEGGEPAIRKIYSEIAFRDPVDGYVLDVFAAPALI